MWQVTLSCICSAIALVNCFAWTNFPNAEQNPDELAYYTKLASYFTPHSRDKRQIAGTNPICVPTGTCITNGTGAPGTIDPRIVTPGVVLPNVTQCLPGQDLCYGLANTQCGQRFVQPINTADGPADLGAFPWQAYIMNQTAFTGGGVLVDTYHVITAAHKVNLNVATPGNIRVYLGVSDPRTTLNSAQMRTAARIQLHPSFDPATLRNDIAVIRLSAPISLGYQRTINTACMAAATTGEPYVGNRCLVSGWGQTAFTVFDAPTSPQKQVTVPIVNYATCRTSMAQPNILGTNVDRFLDNNELCAGGEANRDACTQDGGSPLVCPDATGRYTVVGLVIWGKNCGQPGVYGVYVDIGKYRTWIDSTIAILNAG